MITTIAGTAWQRTHDASHDIQIATVADINDAGRIWFWCVGCTLYPTQELIMPLSGLVRHIRDHQEINP